MLKDFVRIEVEKGNWQDLKISHVETNLKDIKPKPKQYLETKIIIPKELIY